MVFRPGFVEHRRQQPPRSRSWFRDKSSCTAHKNRMPSDFGGYRALEWNVAEVLDTVGVVPWQHELRKLSVIVGRGPDS